MFMGIGNRLCKILPVVTIASLSFVSAAFADYSTTIDPSIQFQTVEGWGTSLAWWGNAVGGYSNNTDYADKIFGPAGLNLNVARYNIGGGENPSYLPPNTTYLSYRARVPGFEPSSGIWDWTADANQRWMLQAAKARGADQFEAFSNSPPYWMTNSGSVTGSTDGTSDNLNSNNYDAFADYLTTVVKQFKNNWGITFRTLEPLNEPIANWWKFGGSQEGTHFARSTQNTILGKVAASLSSKGLSTKVSASDENSINDALTSFNSLSSSTKNSVYQINTHSYNGSQRVQLSNTAQSNGKKLWMSEYGDSDATGLTMSKKIMADMKQLHATAWVYWQAVDNASGWGFLKNPLDGSGDTSYTINQKYYVMGNYSKFIRPGYKIIAINDDNSLAAYDPFSSNVVIVTTNSGTTDTTVAYDLSKFSAISGSATPYRTSSTEQLAQLSSIGLTNKTFSATAKAGSVTTYVISGVSYTGGLGYNPYSYYSLTNQNSGMFADVNGASLSSGASILQWTANSGYNQQWSIQGFGDGTYYLVNRNSGMVIDVSGASTTAGGSVIQYPYNGGNNQRWRITSAGNGYYKLVNVNSGMILDVTGASKTAGTTLEQWSDNGGANQYWSIQDIDKTAPVTAATVNPSAPDGQNGCYIHPVTITLGAFDNLSGVAKTEYSLDGGGTWQAYMAPVTVDQDSKYTVSYRSTDNAGNVEASQFISFNLDTTAPVTVSTPSQPDGANGWYVHQATVSLSATDNLAGVAKTEYSLDGGTSWQPYTSVLTFDKDGKYTVSYRSTDNAGNMEAVKTVDINLESTAPVTTVAASPSAPDGQNGWYVHPVTITLSASDNLSGLAKTEYSLDGGSTAQVYMEPVRLSQDSKYTVSYRSTDYAGNVETVKTIGFNLDSTAPSIRVSGLVYGTYSDSMDITPILTLSDNLSGVDSSKTTVTLSTYGAQQPVQQGATIPLYTLPLGTHAFIVTASDMAGSTGNETILFTTTTSIPAIQALVTRFTDMGWIDSSGIANSLQSKLAANALADFVSEVQAQGGKHISSQAAGYLLRDAQYLLNNK